MMSLFRRSTRGKSHRNRVVSPLDLGFNLPVDRAAAIPAHQMPRRRQRPSGYTSRQGQRMFRVT